MVNFGKLPPEGGCYDRARSQTQDQGRFQRRSVYYKRWVESQRINQYKAEHAAQE